MSEKTVVGVVVTYNRVMLLKESLHSLLEQNRPIDHLIVVNNNSSDGTKDFLSSIDDPRMIVFNLDDNIGGAAGFEYGLKKAYEETDDDYIWFMDDDTIPDINAGENMVKAASFLNDDFGFLCSNVRWTDGKSSNVPKVAAMWPDYIGNNLIRVSEATFVSVMIARNNVENLGLPIGAMVIWGDDTEYTTRLSSFRPSFFVINSKVVHKTKSNLSKDSLNTISSDRIKRYYYMYRNLIYISKKYDGRLKTIKRAIFNLKDLFSALVNARDLKIKRMLAVFNGTIVGLFFNPKINYVSKKGQKNN